MKSKIVPSVIAYAIVYSLALCGLSASTVIGFSSEEGYVDGDINGQPSSGIQWTQTTPTGQSAAFVVDTSTSTLGLDSDRGAQYQSTTYGESFSGTDITVSVIFTLTRGDLSPGTSSTEYQYFALTVVDTSGTGAIIARFGQMGNTENRYFLRMYNSVTGSYTSLLTFDGSGLGLSSVDASSDELQLTLTTTYSGSDNVWISILTLYNLTTETIVGTQTLNWTATDTWTESDKELALGNANLNLLTDTTVDFSEVDISAVPEPAVTAAFFGVLVLLVLAFRKHTKRA